MTELFSEDIFPVQGKSEQKQGPKPLAESLRPQKTTDIVGQDHLLGQEGILGKMLRQRRLGSFILWGPPGVGKTTIAGLLAEEAGLNFIKLSAVFSGVAELKQVFERAEKNNRQTGRKTVLFVDEIHRFNRAQQDSFLPVIETGQIILIGATTENPSFSLNNALLSRCPVFVLKKLQDQDLEKLLQRAEAFTGQSLPTDQEGRQVLYRLAQGDGRFLLTLAEQLFLENKKSGEKLSARELKRLLTGRAALYDKKGDGHYGLISALHKALRASDGDAALYWFARMVTAGEDIHFIARRLLRFASEDVGLSDPRALSLAISAWQSYERLGSPEGELALAELIIFLASVPKSNAVYEAYKEAVRYAKETAEALPPRHSLNAPTKLMAETGMGEGYIYDHDTPDKVSGLSYFPDEVPRQVFYRPGSFGLEKQIAERLLFLEEKRRLRRDR